MSIPTSGECFARMIEFLRKAQEEAAMMAHLDNANDERARAKGWLAVSEMLKLTARQVTQLATRRMQ